MHEPWWTAVEVDLYAHFQAFYGKQVDEALAPPLWGQPDRLEVVEGPATMISELDALRTANLLLEQHGAQKAWRMLTARAIEEHLAGQIERRAITQQVLSALHKLTDSGTLEGRQL